ncbi:ATP-dependent DNA helicase pfh1 [Pseudoscourfieldia marina]
MPAFSNAVRRTSSMPAFCIFSNAVLEAISSSFPSTMAELARINGVGSQKCREYGDDVLRIVQEHVARTINRKRNAATQEHTQERLPGATVDANANTGGATPNVHPMFLNAVQKNAIKKPRRDSSTGGAASTTAAPKAIPNTMSLADAEKSKTQMNETQRRVLDLAVNQKRNVFFTGSAGTGKSFVTKTLIALLRHKRYSGDDTKVAVVAPTGIAAMPLGGTTVHKFIGAGLAAGKVESVVDRVHSSKTAKQRWIATEVLIIDEVSMLDADLLAKLDAVGREIRENPDVPFGGMQVIATGDFFQLPPVNKTAYTPPFCFMSASWKAASFECIELVDVVRQKDPELIHALQTLRRGIVDARTRTLLAKVSRPLPPRRGESGDDILPTRLYATNRDVDAENLQNLARLPSEEVSINARDVGDRGAVREMLEKSAPAPAQLRLKKGAQVVLLRAIDSTGSPGNGLVNGSRGVVVGFSSSQKDVNSTYRMTGPNATKDGLVSLEGFTKFPIVSFENGMGKRVQVILGPAAFSAFAEGKYADRLQIPLKLAWALTVHRCQGMTLQYMEAVVGDAFDFGQVYVALSRAVDCEGLSVRGFVESKVKAHPAVAQFYRQVFAPSSAAAAVAASSGAATAHYVAPYAAAPPRLSGGSFAQPMPHSTLPRQSSGPLHSPPASGGGSFVQQPMPYSTLPRQSSGLLHSPPASGGGSFMLLPMPPSTLPPQSSGLLHSPPASGGGSFVQQPMPPSTLPRQSSDLHSPPASGGGSFVQQPMPQRHSSGFASQFSPPQACEAVPPRQSSGHQLEARPTPSFLGGNIAPPPRQNASWWPPR